ncbi:stalk domain-containing protein [Paenibacillus wynnii]|uniref:stalk domain-containing protein n=1 Tax=Paenibacillus wynnii TaxID=268407 RepID=UPI00278F74EC|nr:stalk domain-containing protein [Paenibacillus wynnii]MDQ0196339.1 hypothetical protein [Paenibacillus wynnii]
MKKMIQILICCSLSISFISAFNIHSAKAASSYTVVINDINPIDNPVFLEGLNYIPLKSSLAILGYHVEWIQSDRSLKIYSPDQTVVINMNSKKININGKLSAEYKNEIINMDGHSLITARYLAKIMKCSLIVEGGIINIKSKNQFILGESPHITYWLSNNGSLFSLNKDMDEAPKLTGKINLTLSDEGYSKMTINSISNPNSFVVTATKFSGEPLIFTRSVKIFVKDNKIVESVVFGNEETIETSKLGDLWVFNDGQVIKYLNDHGEIIKTIKINEIIAKDSYSIDGFDGDHIVILRSETKKNLWVIDTSTNRSFLLYKKLLSKEEQASIERNADITDMHYGDNLHLKSKNGNVLSFNYFSYLQGAKDITLMVDIKDIEKYFLD